MSLLDRIYYEASAEESLLSSEEALYSLYQRLPETKEHSARIWAALDECPMTDEQRGNIVHNWELSRMDEERQGFLNGFRFAAMLYRELLGTAGME